ncbi:MAG: DUF3473 domain-containing protein [Hyphomicrobiales bacterium]|nr:DUF3473 domain-containing protein [Hyphomicrobiales bacterium]MCP5373664.1 DUF3473 domain-containing protein [Hyphomicrobiales bacterium]
MTVDVEDYFQVQAFADRVARSDWDGYQQRVERNTNRVLDVFAAHGVHATFFSLGWVAERHPGLIRRIIADGHELGSHGFAHHRVFEQTPDEFRADVRHTKRLLEDIAGQEVRGYRAATFSIRRDNLWAFDVLAEEGHVYSSSLYPVHHDLYGMPEAPRFAFFPAGDGIQEYPITTVQVGARNLPCGGGGYFRLLPYPVSRWAMRRVNRADGNACIFYFHPWEVDPEQPRMPGISAKARFRHYLNLDAMEGRLARLCRDFAWDRMDRVFYEPGTPESKAA